MKLSLLLLLLVVVIVIARKLFGANTDYTSVKTGDVAQLKAEHPSLIWLDVRTPNEIASGKIAGAKEMDIQSPNFEQQLATLPKDRPYLVYCRSGSRSARACKLMAKQGFKQLYNLSGGYLSWKFKQ